MRLTTTKFANCANFMMGFARRGRAQRVVDDGLRMTL
ncbi:Uncharacterised protein [Mycobacteroides abscessus subsp. abscessus]|nr:Uncharacterised protein [Mycobacteroides abscessus subsp. abscessus]